MAGAQAGFLRTRAVDAVEEMDKPDCDPAKLERTYAQFPLINAAVSGWRGTYVSSIRPLLSATVETRLLDIGCGGGDVARALARWAVLDGMSLAITAIDPDPRAHAYASALPATAGVAYRRAHSRELVAEGEGFDVVISNHILHHLDAAEFRGLLQDTEALCPRLAVHSDIARSKAAYALFSAGTRPFFPGSFIRRDGLTSIRRSYTATELAAAVPPPWRVEAARPFRLALTLSAEPGHA